MTDIKSAYDKIGADYADAKRRLVSDDLVARFAMKFLDDQSFANLEQGMADRDVKTAFMAAHTLKGVCSNLGLTNLYEPSSALTEVLRAGTFDGADELFEQTAAEYKKTVAALSE